MKKLIYTGKPLVYLPELVEKSRKEICADLHSIGIECSYAIYNRWIVDDIRIATLISICNYYHLPIYYFFEIVGYEKVDGVYRLVYNEWTEIETAYERIIENFLQHYATRKAVIDSGIISERKFDALNKNNHDNMKKFMASDLVELLNISQTPIIYVLIDRNVPFVKDQVSGDYKSIFPGYDVEFHLCEETDGNNDDDFNKEMQIRKLQQKNTDLMRENATMQDEIHNLQNKLRKEQLKKSKVKTVTGAEGQDSGAGQHDNDTLLSEIISLLERIEEEFPGLRSSVTYTAILKIIQKIKI